MKASKSDVIFFLGAGFSKAAGAPLQSELLPKALKCTARGYEINPNDYANELKSFLKQAFQLTQKQVSDFDLEDFYTPIDKCIAEGVSFRGYSVSEIKDFRNKLSTLIGIVVNESLINATSQKEFIDEFCLFIVDQAKNNRKRSYSLITTNWDVLIDRRLWKVIDQIKNATIDYGSMVVGLSPEKQGQIIPPFIAKERKGFSVKLYKIHGSLNMLICPSCNRLYVSKNSKADIYKADESCRFCLKQFSRRHDQSAFLLQPYLLYPTFIKELSNTHISSIWRNVFNDLSETKKIVFMGYSFPQADFEIRQLLSRRLPDDSEIIHVGVGEELKVGEKNFKNSAQGRYRRFFGKRSYKYYDCGVEEFISKHLKNI